MSISVEELTAIAQRYWRADKAYHSRLDSSPEHERLGELWERELRNLDRWFAFLDALKKDLPEFTIGNATATPDACFRCAAYAPASDADANRRFVVVGAVSILAPVYAVYGVDFSRLGGRRADVRVHFEPLPTEMRPPAEVTARRIESSFQVRALPREVAETPIPLYVEPMEPPATTLFHALFTGAPASLP
jgi:hypothetical protein